MQISFQSKPTSAKELLSMLSVSSPVPKRRTNTLSPLIHPTKKLVKVSSIVLETTTRNPRRPEKLLFKTPKSRPSSEIHPCVWFWNRWARTQELLKNTWKTPMLWWRLWSWRKPVSSLFANLQYFWCLLQCNLDHYSKITFVTSKLPLLCYLSILWYFFYYLVWLANIFKFIPF